MRSHLLKFAYEVIYDMKENINKIFAPNLICVCIDTVENGDYIGKFWHQYDDKPRSFRNMTELLRNMEALYDEWDFPQKSTILRSFNNKRGDACVREEEMQNIMPGGLKTNMERREPLSSTSSTGRMPPGRGRCCGWRET